MRITWAITWELHVKYKTRARRRKETLATEGTQELSLIFKIK